MNKKIISYLIILILVISCTSKNKQPMLPSVSGKPGTVTIVINKAEWDTYIGEELREIFETAYDVLPQYEPVFDIMHVAHDGMSSVVKNQRNILIVNINPRIKESKIIAQKDLWAKPQLVISMVAANDSAFIDLLNKNKSKLISLLEDIERKRLMDIFRSNSDLDLHNKLHDKYNINLLVPKGYKLYADSTDYTWISQEFSGIVLSLLIYQYNYKDTNTFTLDYLIKKRDEFARKIPGEVEGSYMVTESLYGPFFNDYMLRGTRYVAELRGLWRMEQGYAMGGPFISITTLDEKRNKIITVEGFVFAAGKDKRNYLRQVEAIVLSLEISE